MRIYELKDVVNQEVINLSRGALLEELNRDRSEEWTDYVESDSEKVLAEGIAYLTEYELLAVREVLA